jgi:hypothetical protein
MLRWSNLVLVSLVLVGVYVYQEKNLQPKPNLFGAVAWGVYGWVRVRQWEDEKEKA